MYTGLSQRDVYVHPPLEARFRNMLRLPIAAAHVLVSSNSKWQKQYDDTFLHLGFRLSLKFCNSLLIAKRGSCLC